MQQRFRAVLKHPITILSGGGGAMILAGGVEYALSLGTSGLLPVATGIVTAFLLFISRRTLTAEQEKEPHKDHAIDSKRDEEDGSKAQPEFPLPIEGERIFSRRTPEELVALVKDHTGWTASDLTRPHIGTWLRIEGTVDNISPPSDHTITVSVDLSRGHLMRSMLLVFLSFDKTRWRDRLRILTIGDPITVIGKIRQIDKETMNLEECELIGH